MKALTLTAIALFLTALTAGAIPSRPVPLPIPVARRVKRHQGRR